MADDLVAALEVLLEQPQRLTHMFFGIIVSSGANSMALVLADYSVALCNSFHTPSATTAVAK